MNTDLRASVRSTAFHCSSGGRSFMEAWKMIFGLLFCIGFNSNTFFVRGAQEPGRFCATLVQPYYSKYGCQEYKTTTVDGFRLGVQRIYSRAFPSKSNRNSPIFFNHGILTSGISWVVNPPDQADVSPAFVLADAGYDVWIGNARTTSYSYGHEYLTELDKAYWDWSLDELAAFDLPSMMYLVHNITNRKVHLIGHSQGAQCALAALSEGLLVDIVDKVALLAPVAYDSHILSPIAVAGNVLNVGQLLEDFRIYAFSSKTPITGQQIIDLICLRENVLCINSLTSTFTGINCCLNISRSGMYETSEATSAKNLIHLAQLYRANKFQKYDYGAAENNQRYNSIYPPAYDLSRVPTQNLFLASGGADPLADLRDVEKLKCELRAGYKYVFKPKFAHLDFLYAIDGKEKLYDSVIAFLQS